MKDIISPIDTADGLFHDGDPSTSAEGTVVYAKWLNAMQGAMIDTQTEHKNILAAAGMQPKAEQNTQITEAINSLILQSLKEDSRQSLLKKNNGEDIPDKTAFVKNLGLSNTIEQAQNALDKRTGGTINGPLTVESSVAITGPDYLVKSGITHDKANNARNTQGLRLQGEGAQGSDIFFWEQIGQSAAMKFHVWSGGRDGVFDFHNTGEFRANGGATFGGNVIVSWGGRTATFHENGDVTGPLWGGALSAWIKNRTQVSGGRGGWWYKDESSGFIFQGGVVNRSDSETRVNFPRNYQRECFGVQLTPGLLTQGSRTNLEARYLDNNGFTSYMGSVENNAYWWAVGV